jgi:hypothetical protein
MMPTVKTHETIECHSLRLRSAEVVADHLGVSPEYIERHFSAGNARIFLGCLPTTFATVTRTKLFYNVEVRHSLTADRCVVRLCLKDSDDRAERRRLAREVEGLGKLIERGLRGDTVWVYCTVRQILRVGLAIDCIGADADHVRPIVEDFVRRMAGIGIGVAVDVKNGDAV